MQGTMKAARIYGFEKTSQSRDLLKVDDVPIPDIESGEVLIRVLRAGLLTGPAACLPQSSRSEARSSRREPSRRRVSSARSAASG